MGTRYHREATAASRVQELRDNLLSDLERLSWDFPDRDVVAGIELWFGRDSDFMRQYEEYLAEDRVGVTISVRRR